MLASAIQETAAMPMPALAVSAASATSLLRRKYWPTMRLPLSRTRATPRAEISNGQLYGKVCVSEQPCQIYSKKIAWHFICG